MPFPFLRTTSIIILSLLPPTAVNCKALWWRSISPCLIAPSKTKMLSQLIFILSVFSVRHTPWLPLPSGACLPLSNDLLPPPPLPLFKARPRLCLRKLDITDCSQSVDFIQNGSLFLFGTNTSRRLFVLWLVMSLPPFCVFSDFLPLADVRTLTYNPTYQPNSNLKVFSCISRIISLSSFPMTLFPTIN